MDYAAARAAFFNPRDPAPGIEPDGQRTPARGLRDAIEPIATICFWSEPANTAYAELGLNFLTGYIWGRASTLGEPNAGVVAAAFGVFEPGMIADTYAQGRATASIERLREARERGSVEALERALGAPDGVPEAVTALRRGVAAADPTARPFFAGLSDLAWPQHPLGALWHATTMLREYRGDVHLAACAGAGLSGLQANLLTELQVGWDKQEYTATRGWPAEEMDAATDALRQRGLVTGDTLSKTGTSLRADLERATDERMQPVLDAIGDELPELVTRLDGWSELIIAAGWFPPDPFKRASG